MRLFVLALFLPALLAAIEHTGSVRAADQFIPGATVTARQGGAKLVAYTDESGRYTLDLTPGVWDLEIAMAGFDTLRVQVEMTLEPSTRDWTMEVPRLDCGVGLPACAPERSSGPGFQILPLTATAEGEHAVPPAAAVDASTEADDSFIVNGSISTGALAAAEEQTKADRKAARTQETPSLIAAMAAPDPLGLGKRGKTNRPAGKAGKRARGGVTATSFGNKRKQPAYTGTFSLNANNSAFNAAPYSLNGRAVVKPSYARENIVFNLGGPLRIPWLLTNDRVLFYIDYQANRAHNASTLVGSLPTLEERAGDFSAARTNVPVNIFDPASHAPFPNNVIPRAMINPAAAQLLQYFPQPLYPGMVQNYQSVTSLPNNSDSFSVRLNLPVSRKDRLSFNQQYSRNASESQTLFGFRDSSNGYGLSTTASWNHSFRPRLSHSFTFNFSRSLSKGEPFFAYTKNVAADLGIAGTSQDPISWGPPNLSFTNFSGLADGSASINRNQTTSLTEAVTYVRKKHNFTFGFTYRRMQQNALSYANSRGSFSFSGLLTSGFDANGQPLSGTGMDFADFLLGLPQTSSLRLGNSNNYFRGWSTTWYGQDDWRVRPNFSLMLGLRYEYFSPFTELRGHLANLDLAPQMNAVAVVTPGSTGPFSGAYPAGLIDGDPNNYSPRLGFSWRPSQKHSRVIRGGYSIFFNGAAYGGFAARMAAQPPFATTASLSTSTANPLTLQNGFPTSPPTSVTNTFAIDRNYRPAYAQTWTLALQQTLPHNLLAELEYVGTKGTGLDITTQPNRATPGSPLTAQQRLQIGNATGFTYQTSNGNSIFHSGQLRLTRRFSRGVSANALYTFAKSIDNASSFGGGGSVVAQNPLNLALERGVSSFDQRHKLAVEYTLASPVGINGLLRNSRWPRRILTGWTLSGGFNATAGTPLTARVSGNLANTGGTAAFGTGRAQATGAGIHDGDYPYFNLGAFSLPLPGQYGNAGRNTIPGWFQTSMNTALNRTVRLGDGRRQVHFRIAANNALNHVTVTNIGTTVNSATYGLPVSASATRSINMVVRLNF